MKTDRCYLILCVCVVCAGARTRSKEPNSSDGMVHNALTTNNNINRCVCLLFACMLYLFAVNVVVLFLFCFRRALFYVECEMNTTCPSITVKEMLVITHLFVFVVVTQPRFEASQCQWFQKISETVAGTGYRPGG